MAVVALGINFKIVTVWRRKHGQDECILFGSNDKQRVADIKKLDVQTDGRPDFYVFFLRNALKSRTLVRIFYDS